MSTDEDKSRLVKLLQDLDVPEERLPERCQTLVKNLQVKFTQELQEDVEVEVDNENPYVPDKCLLDDNERKLRELLSKEKRTMNGSMESGQSTADPNRPWRTNSNKEKLLRIDCDLKRHLERSADMISPLADVDMQLLVRTCEEEARECPSVGLGRLRETVDEARRKLPNFQYRTIENSTATAILPEAHCDQVAVADDGRGNVVQ